MQSFALLRQDFGGFKLGGWHTGGQAKTLAEKTADARVLATLVPVCADGFMRLPDAPARLAVLIKTESYSRNPLVEKGLVIPGLKSLDYQLLSACGEYLVEQAKTR